MTHPALRHPGAKQNGARDTPNRDVTICARAAKKLLQKENEPFDTAIHPDEGRHYTVRKTQVLL